MTNNIRFSLKNLGPITQAEIALNSMTILAGKNSVSKTYLTYLIFGFLDYLKSAKLSPQWQELIAKLLLTTESKTTLKLSSLEPALHNLINYIANNYTQIAYQVISLEPDSETLANFKFAVMIDNLKLDYTKPLVTTQIQITPKVQIKLDKNASTDELGVYIIIENNAQLNDNLQQLINSYIAKVISNYFISQIFPTPFIITSERTGVAMFYRELDNSRSTLIETLQQESALAISTNDLLIKRHISRYPLPIKLNMDFIRNLFDLSKNKTNLPSILKSFISKQICSGKYSFDKALNQIFFTPSGLKKVKLPIHTTSSSIKSLLLFDSYINFLADTNHILIIDEPELSLHPDNQRKIARFLSMLANYGIKVLFTTHSDYIVKEINNLIMLYNLGITTTESIIQYFNKTYDSGYTKDMLIKETDITCYTVMGNVANYTDFTTQVNAIDEYGINLGIIDDEINNLGEISQILYSELEHDYD